MTKSGIAFAIVISVLLSSSAWAVSQGAACRPSARAHHRSVGLTLVCWASQDPWQDCGEDPWQLSFEVSSRDAFSDPWQDSVDPWQPFDAKPVAKRPARPRSAGKDFWQSMLVRVVRMSNPALVRDSAEDPWQPAFADPWQDDVEDPWQ